MPAVYRWTSTRQLRALQAHGGHFIMGGGGKVKGGWGGGGGWGTHDYQIVLDYYIVTYSRKSRISQFFAILVYTYSVQYTSVHAIYMYTVQYKNYSFAFEIGN